MNDRHQLDLSIIIPIYNSESMIKTSVKALRDFCKRAAIRYEILLRNDGSTDSSGTVLQELIGEYEDVFISQNDRNYGLGHTLRALLAQAKAARIIYCDIDLLFGMDGVRKVYDALEDDDLVVASRYLDQPTQDPWLRRFLSRMYYGLCRLLFRTTVRDIGSGTVGIRREVLQRLPLQAEGFDIHIEMLHQARRSGLKIKEVGVSSVSHPKGSFRILTHGPKVVWDTLCLFLKSRKRQEVSKTRLA